MIGASASAHGVSSSQSVSGRNWLCGASPRISSSASTRVDLLLRAAVEHVGGDEVLHVLGDLGDRLLAALVAERRPDLVRDRGEAVAAQLEGEHEVGLRRLELARRVEVLSPVDEPLGGAAIRLDLGLELELGEVLGVVEAREEPSLSCCDSATSEFEVADVVLELALLAGVEAARGRRG